MVEPLDYNSDTKALSTDGATVVVKVVSQLDNGDGLEDGAHLNLSAEPLYLNNKKIDVANLGITLRNAASKLDFYVDARTGHLYAVAEDAENYNIDEDGHLIYTCK